MADEIQLVTAGVISRRLERLSGRPGPGELPVAWSSPGGPRRYPVPPFPIPEPEGERVHYEVVWATKATNYRDKCEGLTISIVDRDPDSDLVEITTSAQDQSIGVAGPWFGPVDSWCRGDLVAKVSPDAASSNMAVEFEATFSIGASKEEQLVEIGYSTAIDATYGVSGGRSSSGKAKVTVKAGIARTNLAVIDVLDVPYSIGTVRGYQYNELDLEGEAVLRIPASDTTTTGVLVVEVLQVTDGKTEATLTSKQRSGVIVFRAVSTLTSYLKINSESYPWPPPIFRPRPFPPI